MANLAHLHASVAQTPLKNFLHGNKVYYVMD